MILFSFPLDLVALTMMPSFAWMYSQPAGKPASLHAIYFPQSARPPDFRPLQVPEQGSISLYFLSIISLFLVHNAWQCDCQVTEQRSIFLYFLYSSCTMHDTATAKCQNKALFLSIFSILHVQYMTMREAPVQSFISFYILSIPHAECITMQMPNLFSFLLSWSMHG
jgi:hypothetical protein